MNYAEFQNERYAMLGKRETLKEQRQIHNVTAKALLAYIRTGLSVDVEICDIDVEDLIAATKVLKSTVEEIRKIDSKIVILDSELRN